MAELSDQSMIHQRADVTTTFTASGTYTSPGVGPGQADYLVVAGGGGAEEKLQAGTGGGGAGGYRTSFPCGTKLTVPASPISVTVGAGGAAGASGNNQGTNGSDSIFANSPSPITSTGGGRRWLWRWLCIQVNQGDQVVEADNHWNWWNRK
jgi:hypothetical protein